MKLAIVGSRNLTNEQEIRIEGIIEHVVRGLYKDSTDMHTQCQIVSGGAKGVDSVAKTMAGYFEVPYIEFLPDWDKHGKSAGLIRNKQIVNECDKLIAFWDGESRGTQHSINLAKEAGKLLAVFYINNL